MFITNKHGELIKEIETSFEYCYAAACGEDVSISKLLSLRHPRDCGWIRFYPDSDNYGPDTDDTALFYIALLTRKDTRELYKKEALSFVQSALKQKTSVGLIKTWPHRSESESGQEDFMVNLHFVWLLNLLNMFDEEIIDLLNTWLSSNKLATNYYHNETFILYSCLKVADSFNLDNGRILKFKSQVAEAIERRNISIPNEFKELKFHDGVFRHLGKEVYFHFFKPVHTDVSMNLSNNDELDQYYSYKRGLYSGINRYIESTNFESFDFENSLFYKMGIQRVNKEGSVVQDQFAMFDTTRYSDFSLSNRYVNSKSLSLRVHLQRALVHLPDDLQALIRHYWTYALYHLDTKFQQSSPNSFMGLHLGAVDIPRHTHTGAGSTYTFVTVFGKEPNDAYFIIGDKRVDFPRESRFFCIHLDGEYAAHEVIKRDRNRYMYFVFDFDFKPDTNANQFIEL